LQPIFEKILRRTLHAILGLIFAQNAVHRRAGTTFGARAILELFAGKFASAAGKWFNRLKETGVLHQGGAEMIPSNPIRIMPAWEAFEASRPVPPSSI
jgi:hypothetical protein